MMENIYSSPEMEINEFFAEGVLCNSNYSFEMNMNPEEGKMF